MSQLNGQNARMPYYQKCWHLGDAITIPFGSFADLFANALEYRRRYNERKAG